MINTLCSQLNTTDSWICDDSSTVSLSVTVTDSSSDSSRQEDIREKSTVKSVAKWHDYDIFSDIAWSAKLFEFSNMIQYYWVTI